MLHKGPVILLASMGLLIITLAQGAVDPNSRYPDHWWKPFPREKAYSWEVLPQDAGPGEVILSKRNELGKLSNFAATPFKLDGKNYASLEGFWQAMKYPEGKNDPRWRHKGVEWKFTRAQVEQMTAFEAKDAGSLASTNMKIMGINWVTYRGKRMTYRTSEKGDHFRVIERASWAKVRQNPEVRRILLQTGDLVLRPDHHQGADAPPAWKYYQIYMDIRNELQRDRT